MKNLLLILMVLLSTSLFAQTTFLSEPFNIASGQNLSDHGWFVHSGSTTNPIQTVSPPLSWNTYILSNQGSAAAVVNTGQDLNKPLSASPATGAVYASFMVRVNDPISIAEQFFFHLGYYNSQTPDAGFTNVNTAFRGRTFVAQGSTSAQFKLGLSFNATSSQGLTQDLNVGQTYLVVVKYEFVAGALNDQVSLYVFAEGSNVSVEPTVPTLGPFTNTGAQADAPSIQNVVLRQAAANQNAIVDGIVVRDFWQLAPDCNGDLGGTAFIDACNVCVGGNTGLSPCVADCNGVPNGTAFLDNCNTCVGGNTGLNPCVADCNGVFGGTAFFDNCNTCVGGTTGLTACVQDCNGTFGGSAYIDYCNTCVAGNTGLTPCPTTLLEDQIDYPAGDPLTNHGWYAHSAAATNPILVSSPGLQFDDYLGSNIGNAGAVTNTGQDINKPFTQYATNGDVYASYLVRVDDPIAASSEGFFMHFGTYANVDNPTFTSLSTGFRGRVHVVQGSQSDKFRLGLSFNAALPTTSTVDLNAGQTYLVVVKYQFVAGASNDNVSLFVFDEGDDFSIEPNVPALGPLTATPTDPLDPLSPLASDAPAIQAIALRQYNAAQEIIVDGVIVRNVWDIFGGCIPPAAPINLACWQIATLNETTCEWEVSGTQPPAPTNLECWQTATFNNGTCAWEVTGTAPVATISSSNGTTLNCSNDFTILEATGGSTVWTQQGVFFGTANPILVTYFMSGSITYGVTVTDGNGCTASTEIVITMENPPAAPTNLACYETATFDYNSCQWVVTGTQPSEPTNLACWETATFNNGTCSWDVTGTQVPAPTNLACWETATFNNGTCSWDVTGTQPPALTNLACWETATFNTGSCQWDVTGSQPPAPTNLECWQTATFNNGTCAWEVTGSQTIPSFAAVGPYCSGDIIPSLPTTSLNNVIGTWSPAINNTQTTVYTFTPLVGECASTTTLTITIQTCGGNAPANDEPCGALEITSSGQTELNTYAFISSMTCNNQIGNNTNASAGAVGASCGGTNGGSMWYTFTTPMCDVGGNVPFAIEFSTNNAGTNFNTKLAVFSSGNNLCDGPLTEIACNDDHQGAGNPVLCGPSSSLTSTIVINTLQPNTQYWIYVDGFDGAIGDFVLSGRALTAPHSAITTGGGTQIQLTTQNMGAGLYTYYYKQVGSTGYSTSNSPSSLTDVRTLASGNNYITQVMYRCDDSDNLNQSQHYRTEPQTIALVNQCAIVNDMTCTFNGQNSYTLTWSQPAGTLFTENGLSGYRIKRNPIGSTGVFNFGNPAVVCVDGTCSVTLPGNSPTGFNWTIETRCSATNVQVGNTTSCSPNGGLVLNPDANNNMDKSIQRTFSFINPNAGIEFVDVQMHDAYADFGLNTPLLGDYEIFVNDNNEITWRRVDTPVDANFDFVIVPNPSNAMTTVYLNTIVEEGSFTIVDAMGRTIQTGSINNTDNVNIDAAQMQSGVYMVVVTVDGIQTTKRLVVAE